MWYTFENGYVINYTPNPIQPFLFFLTSLSPYFLPTSGPSWFSGTVSASYHRIDSLFAVSFAAVDWLEEYTCVWHGLGSEPSTGQDNKL